MNKNREQYQSIIEEDIHPFEAICKVLELAEVEYVFCLPGGNMSKFILYLRKFRNIKPILVRHEQIASIMTEVYGRLTGKVSVYTSQGAWAVANGTMGAIEALLGSSPMLILTDTSDSSPYSHHAPYQVGTGEYGGFDVQKSLEAVTKYSTVAHNPIQAVQSTQLAIKHALSNTPGPVSVIFHSNALKENIKVNHSPKIYDTKHYLQFKNKEETSEKIKIVFEKVRLAKHPIILAGNGVNISKANEKLQTFAEIFSIPVVTTAGGKSAIAETHHLSLGLFGNWGQDVANKILAQADLVLIIGSRLTPTDTIFENDNLINPINQTLIQIDIEEKNASWSFPMDHVLIGDNNTILGQLVDYYQNNKINTQKLRQNRKAEILSKKEEFGYMEIDQSLYNHKNLFPQVIVKELENFIDDNTMLTLDSGENRVFMTHFFKTKKSRSIISPTGSGAMGYAIPSAIATKLVYPKSEVIAVCGDGGFSMTMSAIMTAVQYDINIIIIVLNNFELGWVKSNQNGYSVASEYGDWNFSRIAESLGGQGIRVENLTSFSVAMKKALNADKLTVIDVLISTEHSYRKAQSTLLKDGDLY